jgi:hypothetical protein
MPFDPAARSINEDWGTSYDGKQMQRWAEHEGDKVVELQEKQRKGYAQGKRPEGPANAPVLLAIGLDGGRVQGREKNEKTATRWMEDKVATIASYQKRAPEKPGEDPQPQRLVTTYVGTMAGSRTFGVMARVEAERRGIRQALEVVVIGDGAAWIDTIADAHFAAHTRIIDYYHASERLCDCAKALHPCQPDPMAKRLQGNLWQGKTKLLLRWLEKQVQSAGEVRESDPPNHPRRVLRENLTYFQNHHAQMHYPDYRARGWPMGSGVTESGVKLFNKRVKGTEQFWNKPGVEPILALRALRLSDDDRWHHYMLYRQLPRQAA